ncbi:MAG: sugar phosphate isomerase/epimerase [Thermomicrobiales bacterium]|nr:sugar phosphate isomerase/epimerase [Thermomicrobiales bacterium]
MNDSGYRFATRLNSFRREGSGATGVLSALRAVAAVPGVSAVELNFPQHVSNAERSPILAARAFGLDVTAINLRFDGPDFAHGAFTHPSEMNRRRAIDLCTAAVDLAESNEIPHVILWMGPDGYDYPFQVDYAQLWEWEIAGFREVADRDQNVKVSVEYKPSDPRRISLIRSMADSLLAVSEVDRPNFGVTLDFCHALMAGEQPAASAALALRQNRLFGVHLNDGYGPSDDGMMVGSVHLWQTLELLLVLRQHSFVGTIYFDTFPERVDPAAECAANIEQVRRLERLLDCLDVPALRKAQARQDSIGATRLLHSLLGETGR